MIKKYSSFIFIFCVLLFIASCSRNEYPNYNSDLVIAGHAGSGFNYLIDPFNPLPSNSWASIAKALIDGAEGIELDVQLSADNKLILYHDVRLGSSTTQTGCIGAMNSDDVIGMSYEIGFPFDLFQDEKIIGLENLTDFLDDAERTPYLYLDLKPENDCSSENVFLRFESLVVALNKWISNSSYPVDKIYLIAPYKKLLLTCKAGLPGVNIILAGQKNVDASIEIALDNGFDGLIYPVDELTEKQLREIKSKNMVVMIFGGKSYGTIRRMITGGADIIQVNNVPKAVAIRESIKKR